VFCLLAVWSLAQKKLLARPPSATNISSSKAVGYRRALPAQNSSCQTDRPSLQEANNKQGGLTFVRPVVLLLPNLLDHLLLLAFGRAECVSFCCDAFFPVSTRQKGQAL